jgi:hypothetical protein
MRPVRSWEDIQNQLVSWLNSGTVTPTPAVNATSPLFFIVPPTEYELYLGDDPSVPSLGIQGRHGHTKYNAASTRDDLIWGVAKTYHPDDISQFVLTSDIFGHELVEAFVDPIGGNIEIGDPCEKLSDFSYRGALGTWSVQPYKSTCANTCIHGDAPTCR